MNEIKPLILDAYHLPSSFVPQEIKEKKIQTDHQEVVLCYPLFDSFDIKKYTEEIKEKRRKHLQKLKTSEIIDILATVAEKWTNPDYPYRQIAEKALPVITGYDQETIQLEIKTFIRLFLKKNLLRFISSEFGNNGNLLDDFYPQISGGFTKAFGPETIFTVFSGNIPGLQIWAIVMGLLVKSSILGKLFFSEPLFPVLFVKTIAEIDQTLADTIVLLPWKGGNKDLESASIAASETIVVYGGEKAASAIRQQVPAHKKFLSYGHKVGFAIIGKETLTPEYYQDIVKRLVDDITIYDQQACLAPQTVFIENGGQISPKEIAQALAHHLENQEIKRPRAPLSEEESLAIASSRQTAALAALQHNNTLLLPNENNSPGTVVFHEGAGFSASPLNRFIHVFAIDDLSNIPKFIKPFAPFLQSVGIAVEPKRLFELSDMLGKFNINRICALGQMNHVSPAWHHDGRFNLIDLVHFTDLERSAEVYCDSFDPDIE
ncbi:acyl-CoA reductase [Lactococcus formosensis]|uniref:acyl-CoA reductase n=1 Tax=Lactococcus formosensis TaxID=1281486 RepID=UPI00254EE7AB|nr:acyl-CoA reductase [Lactococcus formosensis]